MPSMFPSWFHDLALFTLAVIAHWQALLTGGAVMAAIGAIERKRDKTLSWQSYALIAIVFGLYSVFAAWQDEHRNAALLIFQKSAALSDGGFWKSQSYERDAELRLQNEINLEYLKAATESQKIANGTQKSLTELTEKVYEETKPIPPRIITNSTLLYALPPDIAHPSYSTAIVVGSVTRDYPAFKGFVECDTPFEIMQALLTQGVIGATSQSPSGLGKEEPISFSGANWRVGEPLFVLIHGEGLNPITCHIKSQ